MTTADRTSAPDVGQVVSLASIGHPNDGRVLSRSWSPALGEVVRLREEHHGQPASLIVLYGELLNRVFPPSDAAVHP